MAKRTTLGRDWTATEIHKLKGLAKKKVGVEKIARTLKRTVAATTVKASLVGISLDTRAAVCTENSNPDVMVMKPAEYRV
jgi:hypothetical protein